MSVLIGKKRKRKHECDCCEKEFKQLSSLKHHKADIHDIDVTWYECDCGNYKSKKRCNLKNHKANVHKIKN